MRSTTKLASLVINAVIAIALMALVTVPAVAAGSDSATISGTSSAKGTACPNIPGFSGSVPPAGMIYDTIGNCVPAASGTTPSPVCGAGTVLSADGKSCVAADPSKYCPVGTTLAADAVTCIANSSSLTPQACLSSGMIYDLKAKTCITFLAYPSPVGMKLTYVNNLYFEHSCRFTADRQWFAQYKLINSPDASSVSVTGTLSAYIFGAVTYADKIFTATLSDSNPSVVFTYGPIYSKVTRQSDGSVTASSYSTDPANWPNSAPPCTTGGNGGQYTPLATAKASDFLAAGTLPTDSSFPQIRSILANAADAIMGYCDATVSAADRDIAMSSLNALSAKYDYYSTPNPVFPVTASNGLPVADVTYSPDFPNVGQNQGEVDPVNTTTFNVIGTYNLVKIGTAKYAKTASNAAYTWYYSSAALKILRCTW